MRISDWSSDVCSSDLVRRHVRNDEVGRAAERLDQRNGCGVVQEIHLEDLDSLDRLAGKQVDPGDARARIRFADNLRPAARRDAQVDDRARLLEQAEFFVDLDQLVRGARSEEHTSELQSLMRLSYAVFCLKKKTY